MKILFFSFIMCAFLSCGNSNASKNESDGTDTTNNEAGNDSMNISQQTAEVTDTPGTDVKTNPQQKPVDGRPHWTVGKWNWIQTKCCGRGAKITKPDAQKHMELVLKQGGSFDKTDGGSKTSGTWTLGTFNAEDDRQTITLADEKPALLQGGGDTLILNYQYMDLQIEWYVRVKE